MSSSEKILVQESVREFTDGLHSLVSLRHFSEYHEEDKIRKAAQGESNKVLNNFIRKTEALNNLRVKGDLLKKLCLELEKVIEEHLKKNQEYKAKTESFLKKRTDDLCEDFKGTYEAKLLLSPFIDMKSAEALLQNGKLLALCYFENHSNLGNADLYEDQKRKLQEKLEVICNEMLEKHGHFLESRARKSLEEIKKIVLNMSGEIQRDIDTLEDVVSENLRKAKLVSDFLSETGNFINKKGPSLHEELCETLEGVINYLNEAKGNMYMSLEAGIRWAKRLDDPLHSYFEEVMEGFNKKAQESGSCHMEAGTHVGTTPTSIGSENTTSLVIPSAHQLHDDADGGIKKEVSEPEDKVQIQQKGHPSDLLKPDAFDEIIFMDLGLGDKESHPQVSSSVSERKLCLNEIEREMIVSVQDELLLAAISQGQSVTNIKNILNDGANVNVVTKDYPNCTAAHAVISSLIGTKMSMERAYAILNLLMVKGFSLINHVDVKGFTPLHRAIYWDHLDEELLTWFFNNGADFNAVTKDSCENSVLLQAIWKRYGGGILRKILEFGGDPKYVNKWKANALHLAAANANVPALGIFIDQLSLTAVTTHGYTPLHLLFYEETFDYLDSLLLLLKKGADFGAKCKQGCIPLVSWMQQCGQNHIPTLLKVKDVLPITEEIASVTLTAIVSEMMFPSVLSPDKTRKEFAQFGIFLIEERKGKLQLRNETAWKSKKVFEGLKNIVLADDILEALKCKGGLHWEGRIAQIKTENLGKLELFSECSRVSVSIETVLLSLLACENFNGFLKACQCLGLSGCFRL